MDSLRAAYDQYAFLLWLVLVLFSVLIATWALAADRRSRRLEARLDSLLRGITGENAMQMLADYLSTVRSTSATVDRVKREHDDLAAIMPSVVRHVGLVRFSPFHDTGGDQSFALALLDGRADGVIVTALHSRSDSRLYAKPVNAGKSSYSLTPEERQAMDLALGRQPAAARS